MARRSRRLAPKPIIVIYCEGASEKAYFEMLKRKYHGANVHTEKIDVDDLGKQGINLLQSAVGKINNLPKNKRIDQAYVVFDRDNLKINELQQCERYAEKHHIKIIFSSVAIEVWILMHYQPVTRIFTRNELNHLLSGRNYFDTDYQDFKGKPYDEYLFDRVKTAKAHADNLLSSSYDPWYRRDPYTNIQTFLTDIFGVTEF